MDNNILQAAVGDNYSALVKNVRESSELPSTLANGEIVMNSTGADITLGGGSGVVTSFEEPKVFDSINDMDELNRYDVKGALVSYNSTTGKYTVWNGEADLDERAWDYRADHTSQASGTDSLSGNVFASGWSTDVEFPSNAYGTVIAVCVGDGLWAYLGWDPNNAGSKYKWCKSSGTIYTKQQDCLSLSGVECTATLMSRVTSEDESLFYTLKNTGVADGTNGHLYVPSKSEIFPAIINQATISDNTSESYRFFSALAHACHLRSGDYWSSSQNTDVADYAYILSSANCLSNFYKDYSYSCLVLLRFGAALVVDEE